MKLNKPINVFGERVDELTFREPNGADVIKCGFPFAFGLGDGGRKIDTEVIGRYIQVIGCVPEGVGRKAIQGLPPGSVAQLSPVDFVRAVNEVVGFFSGGPDEAQDVEQAA